MSEQKQSVKKFYDNFGWEKNENGQYEDSIAFVDTRMIYNFYENLHKKKLQKILHSPGTYFLELGCGAKPRPEYSQANQIHLCVDLSKKGLLEAKSKLKNKGECILADLTNLPFKNDCVSVSFAAHVLYHVPAKLQTKAITELYRTLEQNKKAVIIYTQDQFYLSKILINLFKKIKSLAKFKVIKNQTQKSQIITLYYHAHSYSHFKKTLPTYISPKIECYSLIDKFFTKNFIPENIIGKTILTVVLWIETFVPYFPTKLSSFQTMTIQKN